MRINLLRHDCGFSNEIQLMLYPNQVKSKCPFYWMLRGGKSYDGNIHYFTFLGIRITIDTTKKKDLWTV